VTGTSDLFTPSFDSLFAGVFAELFGIGTYPEPPDITVLRILGLEARPATQDEVKSAFRARLRRVHPDIDAYEGTHLAGASAAVAIQRPEVRELVWARDVLLRKVPPPPVTDADSPLDHVRDPSRWKPAPCVKCGGSRLDKRGRLTGPRRGLWRAIARRAHVRPRTPAVATSAG
jgi:hypothetical protein